MLDMENHRKELFAKYPAYRLDCIVIEAVEDILKDIPEFAEYFSVCHKQADWEWAANYKRGRGLARREMELLTKDELSILEEFFVSAPRKDALGESRWKFVKKYEEHIQSFSLCICRPCPVRWKQIISLLAFWGLKMGILLQIF